MSRATKRPLDRVGEFVEFYRRPLSKAEQRVEREVFGASFGITSYTTVAQADRLAEALRLEPGLRLLDVGSGGGWPGLYLAQRTGCNVILTDVPREALRSAALQAANHNLGHQCAFAMAAGAALPFRSQTFDAVVHTDVL